MTHDPARRRVLAGLASVAALGAPAVASAATGSAPFTLADLRGALREAQAAPGPSGGDDSATLQARLEEASAANRPVFLPAGRFVVSQLDLPPRTRLYGVPGASVLAYSGNGAFLRSERGEHVELDGLVLDGDNRAMPEGVQAMVHVSGARRFVMRACELRGAFARALQVERSQGVVADCTISGALGDCALMALENRGFSITGNTIESCANNGILVHRFTPGPDGTLVTGNRIRGIRAALGGTGPYGNGINVFRADEVSVTGNHIEDCAFSAIRSNAGGKVRIADNTCLNSGEMAIYSEFEFEGASITGNVVDGGAGGISIANFMQGGRMAVCANNIVRNIRAVAPYEAPEQFFGVGISVEADTAVTGNVVEGAETFGLLLGWGPYLRDVAVTGNVVRQVRTGIAVTVVEGAGRALIAQNVISGFTEHAVAGYRWKERATGDLAADGAERFAHLTVTGNAVG